jgi:O-antigen ligase
MRLAKVARRNNETVDREQLDSWCEKGILGLVLAILVYSPLFFGAVPQMGFDYFIVVEWLTVLILAVWLVRFCVNPKHRLLWPPVCWGVLAFTAYAVAAYLMADVEFLARQEMIKVLVYSALFFAVVNNLHKQETTQIIGLVLIFLAMVISLYAVFQFLTTSDYAWHLLKDEGYRKRGSGPFMNPNHLAGYLEVIFPLALAFTLTGRFELLMKVFLAYATMAIFAGLCSTISRGGWLASAVSLFVFFFWLWRERDYRKRALIVLGSLIVVFAAFLWKADIGPERRERITVAAQVEDVRFQLWQPALAIWKDHFWFGAGPAHFDYRFRQYRPADPALQRRPDRVHNDYLNTLVDWGVVGAVLVLSCWAAFYYQVFRGWKFVQRSQSDLGARRSNRSAFVAGGAIGLLAILVHSFWDYNMHVPANAILTVTLLAIVASHYRFSSERYWHTVRWPLRIPVTAILLAGLVYLGLQAWKRSNESYWLLKRVGVEVNSDAELNALQQAFRAENKNFETALRIGRVYRDRSQHGLYGDKEKEVARQGIEWFNKSMKLNPYDPEGFFRCGQSLDEVGDHTSATVVFKQAVAIDPNGYLTQAYIGWHYFQTEDFATARDWLKKSQTMMPNPKLNPVPYDYLERVEEKLKSPLPPQ